MSKIKDILTINTKLKEALKPLSGIQDTIKADLYASIKEVAELKYRTVELELRIGNLEQMVKILTGKGG